MAASITTGSWQGSQPSLPLETLLHSECSALRGTPPNTYPQSDIRVRDERARLNAVSSVVQVEI